MLQRATPVEVGSHPTASAPRPPLPGRRRSWPVLTVFAAIVASQLALAIVSLDILSSVRAYVSGESLYSKGQKDAQTYLIEYAQHHREADYQAFLQSIAIPLGDRRAREELQKPSFEYAIARQGLIDGGTDPSDIPGAIRLFRIFHRTPLMADAIVTWTEGDAVIEQMRLLAEAAHARTSIGDLGAPAVTGMREQVLRLNERLTALENRFASQLGQAARQAERLLLAANGAFAALLGVTGLLFVRHSSRVQSDTEEEVRRRQESLQRLLDSSAEGLYGVDTAGRCTFINRAALRMLGYDREDELLGRDIHVRTQHSDAQGRRRPPSESAISGVVRDRRELHLSGEVLWRRDGTSFPVDYWSHPIVEDGVLLGAVVTFFDISDRMSMQTALRQGELRIAGLVDAVNDGVLIVGPDERIVLFNRAAERLFGVSAAEAIGGDVGRFIALQVGSSRFSNAGQQRFGDADFARPGAVHELTGLRPCGETFALEASLSTMDSDGQRFVTAVLRDATDLRTARAERQAREALEAASQAKTDFLSRMSHELRTPLNAVLGFTQLLRLDPSRPPSLQQLERIQHIENAGGHLLALVNDVLDLSRVESGRTTATIEAVAIRAVADDAASMVVPLAAEAGVSVHVDGEVDAGRQGFVSADRLRLRQILVNLLSNAIKYNRRGGEVRLGWRRSGGRWELVVADTGVGMSPEKLLRLFEPFNRLGADQSQVEGTGIGLVLSLRLAEMMNGTLRVDSAVGQGTIATLGLLACDGPPDLVRTPVLASEHGAFEDGVRVLYAEDNEVNVTLVRQIATLRPAVTLDVATTGAEALLQARTARPDVMLVDMNLGDMTGLELAHALWSDPVTADIRLVALSADALPEQIAAALDAGFERYLTKPINFRELLDVFDGVEVAS